jgi:hypothetical protein
MKLFEEFRLYENLWDELLKESYIKTFEGKDYDLTDEKQLKELIDLLVKKESEKNKDLPIHILKRQVTRKLEHQLKHEGAQQALNVLDDLIISDRAF